jgi:hypothetical protein
MDYLNNGVIDTKVPFFNQLLNIIDNEVVSNNNNFGSIKTIYENWNSDNISINKSKDIVINKEFIRHENQKIPINDIKLLGIDLPSWFGEYKGKDRVMIIGIDPMRGSKDFKVASADELDHVVLGTPYAYHKKEVRKNKKNKNYSQFIESLIKDNNFIYLTDVYKTFFYYTGDEKQIRSYKYYGDEQKKSISSNQINIIRKSIINTLHEEIKLVDPTLIITLGGISYNQLTGKSADFTNCTEPQFFSEELFEDLKHIPIYPFMHLAARDANLEKFIQYYNPENNTKDFGNLFFEIMKNNGILK